MVTESLIRRRSCSANSSASGSRPVNPGWCSKLVGVVGSGSSTGRDSTAGRTGPDIRSRVDRCSARDTPLITWPDDRTQRGVHVRQPRHRPGSARPRRGSRARGGRGVGAARNGGPRSRRSRRKTRAASRPGPTWPSSPPTRSSRTPTPASATTGDSMPCGLPAGAARATCAGATSRTGDSCGRSTRCAKRRGRSARSTRSSAATFSCASSTPSGARAKTLGTLICRPVDSGSDLGGH